MSCVHPQTLASQARASPAYTPRLEFTLPARRRPLGWRRLISLSLGAYLPSLPPAASRVGLEKGKVPAPDLINSLPPNDSQLRQTNTHIHYQV